MGLFSLLSRKTPIAVSRLSFLGKKERIAAPLTPYDSGGFVQEPISEHGELTHDQARALVEEYRKALLSEDE